MSATLFAPFSPTSFDVTAIPNGPRERFDNAKDALACARRLVSPRHFQVSIEATEIGNQSAFSVLHVLEHKPDTGWLTWVGNDYVGEFPQDVFEVGL